MPIAGDFMTSRWRIRVARGP